MNKQLNPSTAISLTACALGLSFLAGFVPFLSLLAFPLALVALVFQCILHYQFWSAVPEPARSTTPARAVGFLFIPFFNLYWYFPSFVGLTTSIQRATGKPSASGLAVATAVLSLLQWFVMWIPVVGSVVTFVSFVVWLMFVLAVTKDINTGILAAPPLNNLSPAAPPVGTPPPVTPI